MMSFLGSFAITFPVPSSGHQWVMHRPFVMPAVKAIGTDKGKAAMTIA